MKRYGSNWELKIIFNIKIIKIVSGLNKHHSSLIDCSSEDRKKYQQMAWLKSTHKI